MSLYSADAPCPLDAIPLDIGHQQDAHEVLAGLFRELAREGFATDVGM